MEEGVLSSSEDPHSNPLCFIQIHHISLACDDNVCGDIVFLLLCKNMCAHHGLNRRQCDIKFMVVLRQRIRHTTKRSLCLETQRNDKETTINTASSSLCDNLHTHIARWRNASVIGGSRRRRISVAHIRPPPSPPLVLLKGPWFMGRLCENLWDIINAFAPASSRGNPSRPVANFSLRIFLSFALV